MIAVQKENAEIIQILLPFETLPELNRQNFEGDTLLHILLRQYYNQSSNKLINQLLDLKIDVTIKNKSGNLPQHCTECIHSFEILHKHCIKEGIELDVNVKNDEGVCCFTDRFGYWFNDIAKYVTDNFLEKLDYSVRFRENKNLLHYFCLAEFNEFEDLFKDEIFQEKCVRELVNEKDDNGQTPLDFALAVY